MDILSHTYEFSLGGLTTEMTMLVLAMILGFVHMFAATHVITAERGASWNVGARDNTPPLQGKLAGRLDRAFQNFKETFPIFAAAVLACAIVGRHNALTLWGPGLYLAARILYLPLYAIGIPVVRTLVYLVATIGIGFLIAALLGAG
jgi:uncharacterized MAPEG superfamily protein